MRALRCNFLKNTARISGRGLRWNSIPPMDPNSSLDSETLENTVNTVLDHPFWNWVPYHQLESTFTVLHETAGIPFWVSIISSSLIIRSMFIPLLRLQILESHKLTKVAPLFSTTLIELRQGVQRDYSVSSVIEQLSTFFKRRSALKQSVGYSALKRWSSLTQLPVIMLFSISLRKILIENPSIQAGGAFWFDDLLLKDPYAILPLLSLGLSYIVVSDIAKRIPPGTMLSSLIDALQVGKLLMFPLVSQVPAGICLFWVSSGTFSLAFYKGIRNDSVRRVLKLPLTENLKKQIRTVKNTDL